MKKGLMIIATGLVLASCGGYSDEQGKAANDFCDCMDKDAFGDFDINYFECDVELNNSYDGEVFADEGWTEALEEKCPDVAGKMTTAE
ncbi:MAG: hypothetical protein BM555_04435 [Crocinitomix sp. MedPE-SWsnd]|nr:MAG: hypothetical protein BM555_04435 [Crocinitomix sp. MedPE-SWsnd]